MHFLALVALTNDEISDNDKLYTEKYKELPDHYDAMKLGGYTSSFLAALHAVMKPFEEGGYFIRPLSDLQQAYDSYKKEGDSLADFAKWFVESEDVDPGTKTYIGSNPNGKWDYYQLGGRWFNPRILVSNDGLKGPAHRVKDIDWDKTKEAWREWRGDYYDKMVASSENHKSAITHPKESRHSFIERELEFKVHDLIRNSWISCDHWVDWRKDTYFKCTPRPDFLSPFISRDSIYKFIPWDEYTQKVWLKYLEPDDVLVVIDYVSPTTRCRS